MTTVKSYTDLSQSKTLSKILPLESADMYYMNGTKHVLVIPNYETDFFNLQEKDITCWSLAALLSAIPQAQLDSIKQYDKRYWICYAYFASDWHCTVLCNNPVDACYEMIIRLHEQKLL